MTALNFDPRRRRDFTPFSLVIRLAVIGAIALLLSLFSVGVWPSGSGVKTRPAAAPPPSIRPVPASLPSLPDIDQTVLAEVRDHEEAVPPRPFYFLLKRAVEARDAPSADVLPVAAEDLMAQPDAFRGRLVRLRGVFLRDYAVELPENLAGVRTVRNGEIGSVGGTVVTFVLPQEKRVAARLGDTVDLTGYFLQVRRFVSRSDGRSHVGPVVVGLSLQGTVAPERTSRIWMMGLAALAVLVVGGVALATVLRQRQRRKRRAARAGRHGPTS